MSAEIICSCKNISFYHGGKMSAVTVVVSDWPTYLTGHILVSAGIIWSFKNISFTMVVKCLHLVQW